MKRILLLFLLIVPLGWLAGCFPTSTVSTLTLSVPDSSYPPCEVTLIALGVTGGQYTFSVEGKTYTQTNNTLIVTINALPTDVTVVWFDGSDSQTTTETIWLRNTGPVPGRLVINFITNQWTLHARERYIITYPRAYDPEGGPIKLIDATVEWGIYGGLAVFCPPYTGAFPWDGTIEEYHVRLDTGRMIYNAFMFIQGWGLFIDSHSSNPTMLPYSPPDWGVSGYPGGATCGLKWPTDTRQGTDVTITTTWEDEQGATTLDVQMIPANPYIGCGSVQTPSSVL